MSKIIPFPISEFKKRIGKYNFVRELKIPSKKTLSKYVPRVDYFEDFNPSDTIVGYYKIPAKLLYIKFPYPNCAAEDIYKKYDDIYFLCTKKTKNSTDINWCRHWGKKVNYCDGYSDSLFDYFFYLDDYMPIFVNLPNNGFRFNDHKTRINSTVKHNARIREKYDGKSKTLSISEFKKRLGKYNFVRKLKNPSRETIAQLIKNDEYMEDFNFSDVIVGYYKLPANLFYKPNDTFTRAEMKKYFDDVYFLCTKKDKNSKDITWWYYWGKKVYVYDSYTDEFFDYLFGFRDYAPKFRNLPNNGFKAKSHKK